MSLGSAAAGALPADVGDLPFPVIRNPGPAGRPQGLHNPVVNSSRTLEHVARYAAAHADGDGLVTTPVPGVGLMCVTGPTGRLHSTYRPLVCLVLQGAKSLLVGAEEFVCRQGQSVIVSADMPVTGQVVEASIETPYIALAIELDMALLSEQTEQVARPTQADAMPARSWFVQTTEQTLLDCGLRLLRLVDTPDAIAHLRAGLMRELHYWLLAGPNGDALRAIAQANGASGRLARAIGVLRARYREPIAVDALAQAAAMSPAAFHRHFKAMTTLTPVQYQKRLRLVEARRLLRHEAASATRAAYDVGYESVPQFTRDYGRLFGVTPGRDARSDPAAGTA